VYLEGEASSGLLLKLPERNKRDRVCGGGGSFFQKVSLSVFRVMWSTILAEGLQSFSLFLSLFRIVTQYC
jgi:hypothetical protein